MAYTKSSSLPIYFSPLLALIPLLIFISGAMYLGLSGSPDEYGFWPVLVLALIVALGISKDKEEFAKTVIKGMSDNLVMVMVSSWLLSSVIGEFMKSSGLIDTIIGLYLNSGLSGGVFLVGILLIAAFVGTATGTAVGTVLIITPVMGEVGAELGIDPYMVVGAILSGAAFGDDFSPLSDTSIAVATTQNIPIGRSVRSRVKYAVMAVLPALLLFLVLGGGQVNTGSRASKIDDLSPLFMLASPIAVILLCLRGKHILTALLTGITVAVLIGLFLIEPEEIFSINPEDFSADSLIITGMKKGVGISIFSILLIGLVHFVLASGIIDSLLQNLSGSLRSVRKSEAVIVALTVIVNTLLAHNTITIMSIGTLIDRLAKRASISPYRAANLMDISGNTAMHIFPYMITVVLATSAMNETLPADSQISPFIAGLHNYHSICLFIVAIISVISGLWRKHDASYGADL